MESKRFLANPKENPLEYYGIQQNPKESNGTLWNPYESKRILKGNPVESYEI